MSIVVFSDSIYTTNKSELLDRSYPAQFKRVLDNCFKLKKGITSRPAKMVDQLLNKNLTEITILLSKYSTDRRGLFFSAGNLVWSGVNNKKLITPADVYDIQSIPNNMASMYAGRLAYLFNVDGFIDTDASACGSSLKSTYMAHLMLQLGEIDVAVIVSTDNQESCDIHEFFGSNGLIKEPNDESDSNFVIGEGVAIQVLTRESDDGLCRILGTSWLSQSHKDPTAMCETGVGYRRSMLKALEGTDLNTINAVKLHGTNTVLNNKAEYTAIDEVFRTKNIDLITVKPYIGHTMGAAYAVEFDYLLKRGKLTDKVLHNVAGMGNNFGSILTGGLVEKRKL